MVSPKTQRFRSIGILLGALLVPCVLTLFYVLRTTWAPMEGLPSILYLVLMYLACLLVFFIPAVVLNLFGLWEDKKETQTE